MSDANYAPTVEDLGRELDRLRREVAALAAGAPPPAKSRADVVVPIVDHPVTAAEVRRHIRLRRSRDELFAEPIFADPAWDILLDLYAAHLENSSVSVSSACIAAAVPGTTALRWLTMLTERGLVHRQDDPFDRRRAYVSLAPSARSTMAAFFKEANRR